MIFVTSCLKSEILHDVTADERYKIRLEKSCPLLEKFKEWLEHHKKNIAPKTATGVAINYCLNNWNGLTAFLLDGRLEIDNNRSEQSIKPFVIGRKNFLFCCSPKGATASSMVYSIVETAKENGLNPFEYLNFLLESLPNIDLNNKSAIDALLPWSTGLPEVWKMKKKCLHLYQGGGYFSLTYKPDTESIYR